MHGLTCAIRKTKGLKETEQLGPPARASADLEGALIAESLVLTTSTPKPPRRKGSQRDA
jgi:hypothetical protein